MRYPEDLVCAASLGDEDAWNELVERYSSLIWSVARAHRLSSADSAEVVQTRWMRLAENLDLLRDPARVGAWLCTTARRECLRTLRHNGRQLPLPEIEPTHDLDGPSPDPEEAVVRPDRDRHLWAALDQMPDRCRTLLRALMADVAPSYEEVSAATGMPVASIGPTRARCLKSLRRRVLALGLLQDVPQG